MGRGRAKAKQTKVARDLKYNSGGFDLDRLRADLGSGEPPLTASPDSDLEDDEDDEESDLYDAYADDAEDDEAASR